MKEGTRRERRQAPRGKKRLALAPQTTRAPKSKANCLNGWDWLSYRAGLQKKTIRELGSVRRAVTDDKNFDDAKDGLTGIRNGLPAEFLRTRMLKRKLILFLVNSTSALL